MKRSVTVQVAGQRLTLKTDGEERQVKALVAYVDAKFKEAQRASRLPDTQAVAVLTTLQIAEELFAARAELGSFKQKVRERSEALLDYLTREARI
jgi:cell division protein ZapA (FtsZ GTPase activity inhibitor)